MINLGASRCEKKRNEETILLLEPVAALKRAHEYKLLPSHALHQFQGVLPKEPVSVTQAEDKRLWLTITVPSLSQRVLGMCQTLGQFRLA